MGILAFFTCWANVPFTVAGGIAIAFLLVQASGVLGLIAGGEHEADGAHEVDGDGDADDADAGGDHAVAVGLLGVGRLPLALIWQTYALLFALTGLALNARFSGAESGVPLVTLAWTLPSGLVTGYAAVALLAKVLGPVLSSKKQEATSRAQLVGSLGVVISSTVSPEFGEVRIRDRSGHDLRVICTLSEGARVPREHEQVVVVDVDAAGAIRVAPLEAHAPDLPADVPADVPADRDTRGQSH